MDQIRVSKTVLKRDVTRLETKTSSLAGVSDVTCVNMCIDKCNQLMTRSDEVLMSYAKECSEQEFQQYDQEVAEIQDRLESTMTSLLSMQFQLQGSIGAAVSNVGTGVSRSNEVRLPRLLLPIFTGDLTEWLSFRDLFIAAVHDNQTLSGAQKLQYLKSSLKGEAALLIHAISVTDSNYSEAWDLLNKRFQNKRQLVNNIIKRIVTQPTMHEESPGALRKLIDTTSECVRQLQVLKVPAEHWDAILVYHITDRLDCVSRQQWELTLEGDEVATYKQLSEFLDQRARALSAAKTSKSKSMPDRQASNNQVHKRSAYHARTDIVCIMCSDGHVIYKCQGFLDLSVAERHSFVKRNNLCFNCLRNGHNYQQCVSSGCHKCKKWHHTLLHFDRNKSDRDEEKETVSSHLVINETCSQVLLSTAIINVRDKNGEFHPFRALLDSASEVSFVTENCVQQLGLRKQKTCVNVLGLSSSGVGKAQAIVELNYASRCRNMATFCTNALVLPKVTGRLPKMNIDCVDKWTHLRSLKLADPSFNISGPIDILLGADAVALLFRNGRRVGPKGAPVAFETALGWVLMGQIYTNNPGSNIKVHSFHVTTDIDKTLRQFWELEDLPGMGLISNEEKLCEQHFNMTHTRDPDGRFVVKLPFKSESEELGLSHDIAIRRLKKGEHRWSRSHDQREQYNAFLKEYLSLGHMERISVAEKQLRESESYYLPHHAVFKNSSSTTKLRVVFDASAKTSTGVSLNDKLLIGPKLQCDILELLMRFRTHLIPLCADIEKMYRQVRVHPAHTDFQRIVWRESPTQPIENFRLRTVTYGTACAPYLAVKCMQQLAHDEGHAFPLAAQIVLRDFYVDDLISGANSVTEATELQQQLVQLLRLGGFELRKWSSSDQSVLSSIPESMREKNVSLRMDNDDSIKTLGVVWHPATDEFAFSVVTPSHDETLTKRKLLSDISRIFDPLGWLTPTIIKAKLLIQSLWRLSVGWDDELPENIHMEWLTYSSELHRLSEVRIQRCVMPPGAIKTELVGFCDASQVAYGAVVYCRSFQQNGQIEIKLMAAKSKVAPLKVVSLPRLELCGAVLLVRLIKTIRQSLTFNVDDIHLWTDSTIVLAWLNSPASRWKTFVANRVAEIQDTMPVGNWSHVSSSDNPADCASRGLNPSQLLLHDLWWNGPTWLHSATTKTAGYNVTSEAELSGEERRTAINIHITTDTTLIERYSSVSKLQRVTAWMFRFIHNCRTVAANRRQGQLSINELDEALMYWVRRVQEVEFSTELQCLRKEKPVPNKSRLLCLHPFVDKNSFLRVGGRLQNAYMSPQQKHPVLLPRVHKLTELIIIREHVNNLHSGPQLTLATLQRRFWIVRGRDTVRRVIKQCMTCFRQQKVTASQLMGNLPQARVTPSRAFSQCGVDYAGPMAIKANLGRGQRTSKGYMAIFICFSTKAIHLELVNDLTTQSFLAAFKRFIARRGRPSDLYSDCGTNFVGADKELRELRQHCKAHEQKEVVNNFFTDKGITWHFNPPANPHAGGLWEAGVKSVKHHIRRVIGSATLTYDELYTTLTQIEACLNSRPLTEMSGDPNDLTALTPDHFLIGDSLLAIPEPDLTQTKINHLSRWQLTQRIVQQFWKRWSMEYLSRLQQRPKWLVTKSCIKEGTLVHIKDDNLPPQKWKLGRVVSVHPGSDGLVRIVTLKTSNGLLKRPIVKIVPLPY